MSEHSEQSSTREKLLEHLFVGDLLRALWCKRVTCVEVLRPEVDNGGYDLVISWKSQLRHVQLKSSFREATTQKQNVNVRPWRNTERLRRLDPVRSRHARPWPLPVVWGRPGPATARSPAVPRGQAHQGQFAGSKSRAPEHSADSALRFHRSCERAGTDRTSHWQYGRP